MTDATPRSLLADHPVPWGIVAAVVSCLALPVRLYTAPLGPNSWPLPLLAAYGAVFLVGVGLILASGRWRKFGVALVVGETTGAVIAFAFIAYALALSSVGD
jgi:hypothetical protein